MSKAFTVRVEGHREAPEGQVEVEFTNRKPPEKPKKSKDGPCGPPTCYDPWMTDVHLRWPMSKEEAEKFPVGYTCKVTLAESASDEAEDSGPKKPKSLRGRMAFAASAGREARKKMAAEEESED